MISVARLAWRLSWKGATGWAAAMGLTCVMIVNTYESAYPTALSRKGLATSIGANPAFRALYGPSVGLDTPGGFLSWRVGAFLMLIFGVWALVVTSRLLRGEEESARAELVAVGSLSATTIFAGQITGITFGIVVQGVAVAAGCLSGGLGPSGSVLFAAGGVGCGLVFMAVAAVTSQLAITRRQAASWAALVLGASYLLRIVGSIPDGGSPVSWATPFGWVTDLQPFASPRPATLLPFVACIPALVVPALLLRSRRDLGASILVLGDTDRGRRGPKSISSLALRTGRGTALAWLIGVGASTAVLGLLTVDLVKLVAENQGFADMAARMLGIDLASADTFIGLIFSMLAVVLATLSGALVGSMREEESSDRLDALLTQPVSRGRWLAERIGVGIGVILAVGLFASVCGFLGAAARGADISITGPLIAVANGLPVVALFGSISLGAMAFAPRATTAIGLGLPPLLYLFYMIGAMAKWPGWLLGISPFDHLAPAPALPVNTTATIIMLAGAALIGAIATWRFAHRDLTTE